jgi:hypothetical protein
MFGNGLQVDRGGRVWPGMWHLGLDVFQVAASLSECRERSSEQLKCNVTEAAELRRRFEHAIQFILPVPRLAVPVREEQVVRLAGV